MKSKLTFNETLQTLADTVEQRGGYAKGSKVDKGRGPNNSLGVAGQYGYHHHQPQEVHMKKKKTVAKQVNDPLKYVREFAPSLTVARASLLPFEDLIVSESAGPQNGESEEAYFEIMVDTHEYGPDTRIAAHVTAEDVTMSVYEVLLDEDGEPEGEFELDTWRSSLEGLWEWLRQLPRPARSFRRRTR